LETLPHFKCNSDAVGDFGGRETKLPESNAAEASVALHAEQHHLMRVAADQTLQKKTI
jgi:hypothetical protein